MIWIGTSGWVYPHWRGRFYPRDLPTSEQLAYYAAHFPTVEINRSFYRLPSQYTFRTWSKQVNTSPDFCFAVKASRYITHLKKLRDTDDAVARLSSAASGLGRHLGPFLYQLPPRWHADPVRFQRFLQTLSPGQQAAFEFRDPSWFQPEILRLLEASGYPLAVGVRGSDPDPWMVPPIGAFRYLRFHHGGTGLGFSEAELGRWAEWLTANATPSLNVYLYFNNDPDGQAIRDAVRLRELLAAKAAPLA